MGTMAQATQNEDLLIVEDNDQMRVTLTRTLEHDFAEVAAAASGEEALEIFKKKKYRVVLTDFNMPGITGAQLAELILRKNPETLVIGTSVNNDPQTVTAFKRAGAKGFLPKEDICQLSDMVASLN